MRYCDASRFRTNNEERKCTYIFVYGPINACGDFFLSRSKNLYSCSLLSYTRTMFLDTFTPPTVRKWQQHHHYSWCRGLSRPVCIETMQVFLPLQFFNSIYLMLATASHPRRHHCHLWATAANDFTKGSYSASLMMTTYASLTQSTQENVNAHSFSWC